MIKFSLSERIFIKSESTQFSLLPSWSEKLIDFGRWLRITQNPNSRMFFIFLLPKRHCCSSFMALGAVVGSSSRQKKSPAWTSIEKLENGSVVHLLIDHKGKKVRVEGALGETMEMNGQTCRCVTIQSRQKAMNGVQISLFPENISCYNVSLSPHASQRKLTKLSNIFTFFQHLTSITEEEWLRVESLDSILVTNKASWKRELEQLIISVDSDFCNHNTNYLLQDLLVSGDIEISELRTLLIAPRASNIRENAPLAILDGREAFREVERINAKNIAVILNQSEFDEECNSLIERYSMYRDDSLMPRIPEILTNDLNGIQVMGFALKDTG